MTPWYLYWPAVLGFTVAALLALGALMIFSWIAAVNIYTYSYNRVQRRKYRRMVADPVVFMKEVLRLDLAPWQEAVLRAHAARRPSLHGLMKLVRPDRMYRA